MRLGAARNELESPGIPTPLVAEQWPGWQSSGLGGSGDRPRPPLSLSSPRADEGVGARSVSACPVPLTTSLRERVAQVLGVVPR